MATVTRDRDARTAGHLFLLTDIPRAPREFSRTGKAHIG